MGWAAVILAIVDLVGPYLLSWIKDWLRYWLDKTSQQPSLKDLLPNQITVEVIDKLFQQAIDDLPRTAITKRLLLRTVRDLAIRYLTTVGLSLETEPRTVPALLGSEVAILDSVNEVFENYHLIANLVSDSSHG